MPGYPQTLEVGRLRAVLVVAPPVYAPGGPVAFFEELPDGCLPEELDAAETAAAKRGAVLMIVQCRIEATEKEALLRSRAYTFASSWYSGEVTPDSGQSPPVTVRSATVADIPRILEIGEGKREQYERFSPVFWKKAATPRQEFAPYITSQIQSKDNEALVAESDGDIRGYLIAQLRNLAEGYIDDYAVADPTVDWPVTGEALLSEARRRAVARGVQTIMVVSGHADRPKRTVLESQGLTLRKNWLVLPLPASP